LCTCLIALDESLHRWRIRELATEAFEAKTSHDGGEEGDAALEASVGGGGVSIVAGARKAATQGRKSNAQSMYIHRCPYHVRRSSACLQHLVSLHKEAQAKHSGGLPDPEAQVHGQARGGLSIMAYSCDGAEEVPG